MSMFKKLKGLFVEADPNAPTQAEEKTSDKENEEILENIPEMKDMAANEMSRTGSPSQGIDKEASGKFIDILLKAIDSQNMEGFDYLEFKTALQNLSSMNMDEATKYQSANAMSKTMGVTSARIIESANQYLSILQKEEEKFKVTVQRQRQLKVTDKEQEVETRKKSIIDKEKQIEAIKKQIEQEKKKLEQVAGGINDEAAKIQSTYENFLFAYDKVTSQIKQDIKNIKQYLK